MIKNPLILQAVQEVFNERFEQEELEFLSEEPHVFSKKHNKKMAKLIKDQKKPYFKLICTTGRRVACIIVAVIVVTASALSVKAVREVVFDFITQVFSDHNVITTESGTATDYPEKIEDEYYISELPEGFEETDKTQTETSIDVKYNKDSAYIIFTQHTKADYKVYFDNEHNVFENYTDNDGQKYMIITSTRDDRTTYIWDNGQYVFSISSNLPNNMILELCKSTKIKN